MGKMVIVPFPKNLTDQGDRQKEPRVKPTPIPKPSMTD